MLAAIILAFFLVGVPATEPATTLGDEDSPGQFRAVATGAAASARAVELLGRLPLSFEANQGQADAQVDFLSRGSGSTLFLTPREAVLVLRAPAATSVRGPGLASIAVVRIQLAGANLQARAVALNELPGKVNYFLGNDPAKWRSNIPTYAKVLYQNVYPGIDLLYYGTQGGLEYDFVVHPGAEPTAIALEVQGADRVEVDPRGDLVLQTAVGEVRQLKPTIYQEADGVRREVVGGYVLQGPQQVGFQVGAYDRSRALLIDPVLLYSTYLGGVYAESGLDIALDTAGNAYITGYTFSSDFPTTTGAFQTMHGGGDPGLDVFVTKLNPSGSGLAYSTYLGGSGKDSGAGIAVDTARSAYVTGYTDSPNFPTTVGAFQTTKIGIFDAFVAKLNSSGSGLAYSTYLGGSSTFPAENDAGSGIAVDAMGNAYVTGYTLSSDFPTTTGAFQTAMAGSSDAFVTKLNPSGSGLIYSTYLGGAAEEPPGSSGSDHGLDIAVDTAGNTYVTGFTTSPSFPTTTGAFQTTKVGPYDVFVTKLNPSGSGLVYSTYLGGIGGDIGHSITVDPAGHAYLTGSTDSTDFPTTTGAFRTAMSGGVFDVFVTKLNPSGSGLIYSTYLGGTSSDAGKGYDVGSSIAVDATGKAHVTGVTGSTNFPTTMGALQTARSGFYDAFVTTLNSTGSGLVYSTYLGGADTDDGYGIAVDSAGNVYVTGRTYSTNFPTTTGAYQTAYDGGGSAFVAKIRGVASVPGQIEAEDFDPGGEGVAYHDSVPGNAGGQYRLNEDVDVFLLANGAYVVRNFETGEWLQYTIDVAQGGTYRLDLLVSSEFTTSRVHAELDGQPVTSSVAVPYTGSWSSFWWVGVGSGNITAGQHMLRIHADQQHFDFAALRILPTESPFYGTPAQVPAQIEAEDFDHGGEGVAYHDLVRGNAGGAYRTDVDVDIFRLASGAYAVRNFQTGEWLEYTINVTQAGTYRLQLLVSSEFTTGRWHAEMDGVPVTGSVVVPNTGSWSSFQWVDGDGVTLAAGQHVLRIVADQEYFDFAALRFAAE